jgi:hypothetical protein
MGKAQALPILCNYLKSFLSLDFFKRTKAKSMAQPIPRMLKAKNRTRAGRAHHLAVALQIASRRNRF